jgi:hypothetical protein
MENHSEEITSEFLAELKSHLVRRRVAQGMALLEGHRCLLDHFNPEQHHAGLFTGYLAQWVDLGFERPILVKKILATFSKAIRRASRCSTTFTCEWPKAWWPCRKNRSQRRFVISISC